MTEPKLAWTVDEAAAQVSVSRSTIEKELRKGTLGCKRIGNKRLIPASELEDWFNNLDDHS